MNKIFLCFTVLCCVQYGFALLTPDKLGSHLNKVRSSLQTNCKVLTGATQDQIDQVRQGNFDQDSNIKNYAACVYLQSRLLNKNFDFDLIMFDYYMPPNKDLYLEYLKCNEKWRNTKLVFAQKVWNMIRCVYQQDPANFVFV
ncbi:uncharacterized protein [Diabrotica undecimpunctata]|uniref:uncharacterized protein n=1 Tax=Diabrotica undecimpunctata TaxID=50387 RepID=UPI003B632488